MNTRTFTPIAIVALAIAAAISAACSSTSDASSSTETSGAGACAPHDASRADLTAPVSFAADVVPIFVQSCGLSPSCHGGTRAPVLAARLDPSALHAALVGKPSVALRRMPYVTASSPADSFLMHKMDGDQCQFDAECTAGSCKSSMPEGAPLLGEDERDVVRRWIAQGARDD